jgi:hypothetical protein
MAVAAGPAARARNGMTVFIAVTRTWGRPTLCSEGTSAKGGPVGSAAKETASWGHAWPTGTRHSRGMVCACVGCDTQAAQVPRSLGAHGRVMRASGHAARRGGLDAKASWMPRGGVSVRGGGVRPVQERGVTSPDTISCAPV